MYRQARQRLLQKFVDHNVGEVAISRARSYEPRPLLPAIRPLDAVPPRAVQANRVGSVHVSSASGRGAYRRSCEGVFFEVGL